MSGRAILLIPAFCLETSEGNSLRSIVVVVVIVVVSRSK